ncbi:MAG: phage late control D family protein [Myxococcales bacterium]|nr:phage late control D family protein [Myxococcales bacterium]
MSEVDRRSPGVRVSVLSQERGGSATPLDLRGKVLSFTYEDSATKADRAQLSLDNFDLALFDREELLGGTVLEVSWGYPGLMAPPRRVVVKKLRGFSVLTVEGQALSVLMNQVKKTRGWRSMTRSAVVREVAAEHGFAGAFAQIEETRQIYSSITQAAETDARFLRRLAAREGFELVVNDAGLRWGARDVGAPPAYVFTWYPNGERGELLSVSLESDLSRRLGKVEVRGRDPLAKRTVTQVATSQTVARSTLGDVLEVVDPESGDTSLLQRNATSALVATTATTAPAAQREADARFRRAERTAVQLTLQAIGNPLVRAGTVVELRGISALLSGKYHVTDAKHSLSAGTYTMELKVTRDAVGAQQNARSLPHGVPQGGQPNRVTALPPGRLREVEVVDPESGATQVEYRTDLPGPPGAREPQSPQGNR